MTLENIMLALASIPVNQGLAPKRFLALRRKVCRAARAIWRAKSVMTCNTTKIIDGRAIILGKRGQHDCALHLTIERGQIKRQLVTQARTLDMEERATLLRALRYSFPSDSLGKETTASLLQRLPMMQYTACQDLQIWRTIPSAESIFIVDSGACIELANASKAIAYSGKAWPTQCPK